MANKNPKKPKKTHPWKTTSRLVPTEISKWASEKSFTGKEATKAGYHHKKY